MPGTILAAVDLSAASRRSLAHAADWARKQGARLVVVHALSDLPRVPAYGMSLGASHEERARIENEAAEGVAGRLAQEWVEPLRGEGLDVELVVAKGPPEELILATAKEQDAALIVVGSHGWKGFKRFVLGSVSQSILHEADVPVVVVPAAR